MDADRPCHQLEFGPASHLGGRVRSLSLPARVVEGAPIVLLAAEGQQDKQIVAAKITPKKVSHWCGRLLTLGMAGLERDASRAGRSPKITASFVRRVVEHDHAAEAAQCHPLKHAHYGASSGHQRG